MKSLLVCVHMRHINSRLVYIVNVNNLFARKLLRLQEERKRNTRRQGRYKRRHYKCIEQRYRQCFAHTENMDNTI